MNLIHPIADRKGGKNPKNSNGENVERAATADGESP